MNLLNNKTRLGTLLLLAWSLFYLRAIFDIPTDGSIFTGRTLPLGLCTAMIICGVLRLALPTTTDEDPKISTALADFQWKPAILLIALMFGYAYIFTYLGFFFSSIIFLLIGFFILGHRNLKVGIPLSVGLTGAIWLLLDLLDIYLDPGQIYHLIVEAT